MFWCASTVQLVCVKRKLLLPMVVMIDERRHYPTKLQKGNKQIQDTFLWLLVGKNLSRSRNNNNINYVCIENHYLTKTAPIGKRFSITAVKTYNNYRKLPIITTLIAFRISSPSGSRLSGSKIR